MLTSQFLIAPTVVLEYKQWSRKMFDIGGCAEFFLVTCTCIHAYSRSQNKVPVYRLS